MKSIEWARRAAAEYADKPTPARAHNAAQHLAAALAEIDLLTGAVAELATQRSRRTRSKPYYLTELGEQAIEVAQGKGATGVDAGPQKQQDRREVGGDPDPRR